MSIEEDIEVVDEVLEPISAETKQEEEFISSEDLAVINASKNNVTLETLRAETAVAKRDLARTDHQNQILKLYLKYNLTNNDLVNETTGLIIKNRKG